MNLKMKYVAVTLAMFQATNVSAQLSKSELEVAMAPGNISVNKDPAKRLKAIFAAECAGTVHILNTVSYKGATNAAMLENVYDRAFRQTYKYFDNPNDGTERIKMFMQGLQILPLYKSSSEILYKGAIDAHSNTILNCNKRLEP